MSDAPSNSDMRPVRPAIRCFLPDEHGFARVLSLPGLMALILVAGVLLLGTAAWPWSHEAHAAFVVPVLNPNGSANPGCTDAAAVASPAWTTYGSVSIDPASNPGQIDVGSGIIFWSHNGSNLSWASTTPLVLAVILQSDAGGNAYFYNPPAALFDIVLVPPSAPITLITFCYLSTTPPGPPTLVIEKDCVGGTGQDFGFNVDPDGDLPDPTLGCNTQSSVITLVADIPHTVTEGPDPADNWDLTDRTCLGDDFTLSGDRAVAFTPEAGDVIRCTFTNTFTPPPVAPTLVVAKTCSGGTGPSFSFDVDPHATDPTLACNSQSSAITLVAGTPYTVTEGADPADNWDLTNRVCTGDDFTLSGDRAVTFTPEAGDTVTCTFTNTFTAPPAPTLVIAKVCVDGTGPNFLFDVSPGLVDPFVSCNFQSSPITLTAGVAYTVTEAVTLEAGWSLTGRECDKDGSADSGDRGVMFTPEASDTITCTFTNTFVQPPPAPTLVIEKDCVGGTGPSFFFDVSSSFADPFVGCGLQSSPITLTAGVPYTVTEAVTLEAGWSLTGRECDGVDSTLGGDRGVAFTPAAGDTITCTFTNTFVQPPPAPTLVVEKDCVGGAGPIFVFDVSLVVLDPWLACNTDSLPITLIAGLPYTVTEAVTLEAGWTLTGRECDKDGSTESGARGVAFTPAAGDTITCTFTNTFVQPAAAPTLVVEKDCVGGAGPIFVFDVSLVVLDPWLTCNTDSLPITLIAGLSYTVTEAVTLEAGWTLTGRVCTGDEFQTSGARGVAFTPEAGDTIVCTFTNTFTAPAPTLVIEKDCVGGSGPAFAFDVSPNGSIADPSLACNTNSATITLVAGTPYTVTEGANPSTGWSLTGRTCTGDAFSLSGARGVAFNPEAGDTIVCTFTNTFTAPAATLVIQKNCVGGSGPVFSFDVSPNGSISDPNLGCGTSSQTITLVAGTPYTVTEGSNPSSSWSLTARSCSGDAFNLSGSRGVSFNPEAGDTIVCTFTNTYSDPCVGRRGPPGRFGAGC